MILGQTALPATSPLCSRRLAIRGESSTRRRVDPCHLSILLSPFFFPPAGLMPRLLKSNAMLRKLTTQDSADSLANGIGLSRFQLLANDATLTLGPFAQVVIDDLVAERPRPPAGPSTGLSVALYGSLDPVRPEL